MIKTGNIIDINMLQSIFLPAKSRSAPAAFLGGDTRFFCQILFFVHPLDSIIFFGLFSKLVAQATASLGRSGR